ncbi:MAG: zinc-binding dehydrogenase [Atopobiaceae bacterium]|nr:zinc-binding dehydrogenase [Atopobiaceae bacterium]
MTDVTIVATHMMFGGQALEKTMRAMQISDVTPATEAVMSEVPIPQVKPGWVLVRVHGIGMNHSEWELRHDEIRESYIAHPIIPGIEGVGKVVDPSDQPFERGQKVCMLMGGMGRTWDGSYAEYCLARADHLFAIPEVAWGLPWATLAAIPETFFTAWGSLFECLQLKEGDTLLVRAASCGLGYAALQVARALGVRTIATTHREKYAELLRSFGADEVVLDTGVLQGTGVRANKVLELSGPKTLADSMSCLERGGICCDTGILGGQFVLDGFDPIKDIPNGCYLTGFFSNYPTQRVMDQVFSFVAEKGIEPFVAQVFDFDHLLDALARQDEGGFQGKLVVVNEEG